MKIAIDISPIVYGTGVSRYTKNLVSHLLALNTERDFLLYGYSLRRKHELDSYIHSFKGKYDSKTFNIPPFLANLFWNKLRVQKIEDLIGSIDVLHSSDWIQPPTSAFKVTTIHDLVPILYPKLSHPKIISVHKSRFKLVKDEVDIIIVPSIQTKSDVINLGIKEDRIRVIPEAPDMIYKKSTNEEITDVRNKYKITKKYILCVGTSQRKNVERTIEAFNMLKTKNDLQLVIIGEGKKQSRKGIIFTGHIIDSDMPPLYSGAEALIYPSLYEGFGLPILEAYSCETPVVTSNFGSMKEIAEDGAALVDPYDVYSIKDGINFIVNNRHKFISKIKKIASKYDWTAVAAKTLEVYTQNN